MILWLLTAFATAIERLYRFHRGTHAVRAAIDVVWVLRMSLGACEVETG